MIAPVERPRTWSDDRTTILEGPALASVIEARLAQIDHGHTSERDMDTVIDFLPRQARDFIVIAIDCIRADMSPQDLPRARKKLAQAAALCLAALDRLAVTSC
jgi:hypothetical protein